MQIDLAPLDSLAKSGDFHALNICKCKSGYQASLEIEPGRWRVRIEDTPSAAVRELFAPVPVEPPPY